MEYRYIKTGRLLPGGADLLEFRLLYEGDLPAQSSGRNGGRVEEKHHIRRQLHKQLKLLWQTEDALIQRSQPIVGSDGQNKSFAQQLADTYTYHGFSFIPLIRSESFLTCVLDIVFLRVEKPDYVIESGDLDNRLKVLGDALKMPDVSDAKVLADRGIKPEPDEIPMYCLLGDDKLISELHVSAGKLLLLPNRPERNPNDVYLEMHVKAKLTRMVLGNMDLA